MCAAAAAGAAQEGIDSKLWGKDSKLWSSTVNFAVFFDSKVESKLDPVEHARSCGLAGQVDVMAEACCASFEHIASKREVMQRTRPSFVMSDSPLEVLQPPQELVVENVRRCTHVTRHTSHVTRHTSHVTRHTSHATHAILNRFRSPLSQPRWLLTSAATMTFEATAWSIGEEGQLTPMRWKCWCVTDPAQTPASCFDCSVKAVSLFL